MMARLGLKSQSLPTTLKIASSNLPPTLHSRPDLLFTSQNRAHSCNLDLKHPPKPRRLGYQFAALWN